MQTRLPRRQLALPVAAAVCAVALSGCSHKETDSIGTFRMGERIQVGALTYNVLEAEWKPALTEGGRAPKDRFLFLKVAIANRAGSATGVPAFELIKPNGDRYQEVTHNVEGVPKWLGLFRTVPASGAEEGYIIFDAPIGAYKLVLRDTDVTSDTHALVDIPVQLE
jgi:hypothetical protein